MERTGGLGPNPVLSLSVHHLKDQQCILTTCNLGFLVYKTEVWENTIYVCLCVYEECMLEDWGSVAEHWPSKCVKSPIYDSQNKHTQRESGLGEDKERERMIDKGKTKYM